MRWERVNEYLGGNSPQVGKGDMIPEPMVYKLAFKASNETAEKFQDWLAIEVIPQIRMTGSYLNTAKLSPELQLLNTMVMTMAKQELETKALKEAVIETKEEIREMREVVEVRPYENWRELTNKLVSRICQKTGDYKDTRIKIYDAVNRRAGVDIKRRLENMRNRAIVEGMSRSKAAELTYLDVIAEDRKLIEIYTAIVKELAVKKGVSL